MKTAPLIVSLLALAASGAGAQTQPLAIDPAKLSAHVKELASDAYQGRGPATPAETRTIDYIARQFAAAGLKPGGDHGGWYQDVQLANFAITGPVRTSFTVGGATVPLNFGDDLVVRPAQLPVDHVAAQNAPLVFVGYGITAPACGWDDYRGLDMHGKIAVVLVNDPDFEAPQLEKSAQCFGGKAMTYYGRWVYKYEEAVRHGALGVLIVHETVPAAYGWATVRNSNIIPQMDIVREHPEAEHPLIEGWVQRGVAVDLFRRAGLDFDAEKAKAQSPNFTAEPLKGAGFSIDFAQTHETVTSHNVVGWLPGATRPKDVLIYSAHWDHLGIGPADAKGDTIYHGAFDNASGVAGLIEIGRAFAKGPRPARSVAFIAVTGEEKMLLGATYYTRHPLWPLARTIADLNMDGLSFNAAHDVTENGDGHNDLEDMLAAEATAEGRRFTPDPHPEEGHYFRADHFAFSRAGVPAMTIQYGLDFVNGGTAAGEAWRADYTAHHYHQPSDVWTPTIDFTGGAMDADLYYRLGLKLANSDVWPGWKPESDYKALRDQSAAERK